MEELLQLLVPVEEKCSPANLEAIKTKLLSVWMSEIEDIKHWLSEEEVQEIVSTKAYDFMSKYARFNLPNLLTNLEDGKARETNPVKNPNPTRVTLKMPKKVVAPITSTAVPSSSKRKAISLDYNNTSHHGSCSCTVPRKRSKMMAKKKMKKKNSNDHQEPIVHDELPREYMEKIGEMKGRDVKLVVQKRLEASDVNEGLCRLLLPISMLRCHDFLTDDEEAKLNTAGDIKQKIEATLIDPWVIEHGPGEEKEVINMGRYNMGNSRPYNLVTQWKKVMKRNEFVKGDVIQVWSFRVVEEEDGVHIHDHDDRASGELGLAIVRLS